MLSVYTHLIHVDMPNESLYGMIDHSSSRLSLTKQTSRGSRDLGKKLCCHYHQCVLIVCRLFILHVLTQLAMLMSAGKAPEVVLRIW